MTAAAANAARSACCPLFEIPVMSPLADAGKPSASPTVAVPTAVNSLSFSAVHARSASHGLENAALSAPAASKTPFTSSDDPAFAILLPRLQAGFYLSPTHRLYPCSLRGGLLVKKYSQKQAKSGATCALTSALTYQKADPQKPSP
jgi:hypothetical protein